MPVFSNASLFRIRLFAAITALASLTIGASVAAADSNPEPAIVPAIQQWTGGEGTVSFQNASIVLEQKSAAQLLPIAKIFQQDMAGLGLGYIPIGFHAGAGLRIVLALGEMPEIARPGLPDQAYTVDIGDEVRVMAGTRTGVYYGTRTLLQILEQNIKAPVFPRGHIVDYPIVRQRMLMLDVARKVFPYETLLDYLRMMGWCKMNELHLHLSDEAVGGSGQFRVECSTFPGLQSKTYFYTKQQLRQFQDIAHLYGITVTPEIDMPGHSMVFVKYWPELSSARLNYSCLDVTNPQLAPRMQKLLDEMIPIFDAPDFHIGTDEYGAGRSVAEKTEFGEAFRRFINTMNAYIRTKGKNCRIWSGYESTLGKTEIDPSVIIDMWETDNARKHIDEGHKIINSSQSWTYIVPGGHYYGVSNPGTYNGWEPWNVSGDPAKNPSLEDPHFIGAKLHVWEDQGPTGYDMTEIADLTYPTMLAFAEKMWGRKGSVNYGDFEKRTAMVDRVPGVTVFNRIPCPNSKGIMISLPGERTMTDAGQSARLAYAGKDRADLEFPWTLTMKVLPTGDTKDRAVILSSSMVEVCANYSRDEIKTEKDPKTGVETKTKITRHGIGMVRAAGLPGEDPSKSRLSGDVSRVYSDALPKNQWTAVTIVGEKGHTVVYMDGTLAGDVNDQMVCPLATLGSKTGHSFVGKIRDLTVYNRILPLHEIGALAGLDIPEDLATDCKVTASASDTQYDLTPEKITDGDPHTRWSSGITNADQWIDIDLGGAKSINDVTILWQEACPTEYRIAVSMDGQEWKDVFTGKGKEGVTDAAFPVVSACHIKVLMTKPATRWGYSICDLKAYLRKGNAAAH